MSTQTEHILTTTQDSVDGSVGSKQTFYDLPSEDSVDLTRTEEESFSSSSSSEEIDELKMLQNNEFSPIKPDQTIVASPHSTMYSTNRELMQTAREEMAQTSDDSVSIDFPTFKDDVDAQESDGELIDLDDLPETVTVLKTKDNSKTIYLIGTSHFSKQSHRDVRRVCLFVL